MTLGYSQDATGGRLRYANVTTVLNSGNAAFSSTARSCAKHSAAIAKALAHSLGVSVTTIVKSGAELAAIVASNPITVRESDHARFLIVFTPDSATLAALEPLQSMAQSPEQFVVGTEAAYLYCAEGVRESKVAAALLGKAGRSVTTRNWATVLKLLSLSGASAAAPHA